MTASHSHALVLFGVTGDLATRSHDEPVRIRRGRGVGTAASRHHRLALHTGDLQSDYAGAVGMGRDLGVGAHPGHGD